MPDKDELYVKYRVFYEPTDDEFEVNEIGHPAPMDAEFLIKNASPGNVALWTEAIEIEGPYYVLRPETDHYARVAMAAYAYSCAEEFPSLAKDLLMLVNSVIWDEEVGQKQQEAMDRHPSHSKGLRIVDDVDV